MKINMGQLDRYARIGLGLIIIGLGFYFNDYWGLVGLVPLLTAYLRWCPAYVPFRISTAKKGELK